MSTPKTLATPLLFPIWDDAKVQTMSLAIADWTMGLSHDWIIWTWNFQSIIGDVSKTWYHANKQAPYQWKFCGTKFSLCCYLCYTIISFQEVCHERYKGPCSTYNGSRALSCNMIVKCNFDVFQEDLLFFSPLWLFLNTRLGFSKLMFTMPNSSIFPFTS